MATAQRPSLLETARAYFEAGVFCPKRRKGIIQKSYDKNHLIVNDLRSSQRRTFSTTTGIRNRWRITNSFRFLDRTQVRKDCKINVPHAASSLFYEEGELSCIR
jgi:hypothetical protein